MLSWQSTLAITSQTKGVLEGAAGHRKPENIVLILGEVCMESTKIVFRILLIPSTASRISLLGSQGVWSA